ncbi:MAG: prepilin-type N-terminal cleavage/methylation domain-containing protein [Thermodesulfovibrionales bacterium]|nr:prepilin-type N-terminal cleavage/methylation domain-containing protein [Thermodesulfovibrionales bacterium]
MITYRRKDKGFTLLELLISITLLSIILLIIFGAMRLGHRSIEKAEKAITFLERLRIAINLVESQIESLTPITYDDDGQKKFYFLGQKDLLQFTTNYSLWKGSRGYILAIYSVEEEPDGKKSLYLTERTIAVDDFRRTLLLAGFDDISFLYFEKNPTDEVGHWIDKWTEDKSFPDKIAFKIQSVSKGIYVDKFIFLKNKPSGQILLSPAQKVQNIPSSKERRR